MGKPNHQAATITEMTAVDAEPDPYFYGVGLHRKSQITTLQNKLLRSLGLSMLLLCLWGDLWPATAVAHAAELPSPAVDCAPSLQNAPLYPRETMDVHAVSNSFSQKVQEELAEEEIEEEGDYEDPDFLNRQMFKYLKYSARHYYAKAPRGTKEHELYEIISDPTFSPEQVVDILGKSGRFRVEESGRLKGEPFFENRYYPSIIMQENNLGDAPNNGKSCYPRTPPAKPQVYIVGLHGVGTNESHVGTLLLLLEILTNANNAYNKEIRKFFRDEFKMELGDFMMEAVDLMLNGNGPAVNDQQFSTLADVKKRLAHYLQEIKDKYQIPIIVWGRSASAGLIAEVAQDYPGLIDGIVMVGPTHPNPKFGINSSLAALLLEIYEGIVQGNFAAIIWIKKLYAQMTWHLHPERVFSKIKALIMYGGQDIEVSPEAAREYEQWAAEFPNLQVIRYSKAEHDVFATNMYARVVQRLDEATRFMRLYDNHRGNLKLVWEALTGDPQRPQAPLIDLQLTLEEYLALLAKHTQTLLAISKANLAKEAAKKDGTQRPSWQNEHQRLQRLTALAEQIKHLQNSPVPLNFLSIKSVFYSYYLELPLKFHESLESARINWERAWEADKAGIVRNILLSQPSLKKALPFNDRLEAEHEASRLSDLLENKDIHNPILSAFVDFHKYIINNWPLPQQIVPAHAEKWPIPSDQ